MPMIRQLLTFPSGWEWHVLQQSADAMQPKQPLPSRKNTSLPARAPERLRPLGNPSSSNTDGTDPSPRQELSEFKRRFPECAQWIDHSESRKTNHILVYNSEDSGTILCGTLMIQISDDASDIGPFHFWVSRHRLVSIYEDMRLPLRLQHESHISKYGECELAPEAFFIMISILLGTFHNGLDGFERRLGELEQTMRHRNRTDLLDVIFDRRYDLLHWSHLFIPIREVHAAAKEAFDEDLMETDGFKRISHKLERIETLLKHYALEIDTLISMDDAISSFRGNDIMKTLTIFTVLFLPATVIGAIWGMNFEWLPWSIQHWGFPLTMSCTAVITICIYWWLWHKGWTGDLLVKKREKPRLMESEEEHGSERSRSATHGRKRKKPPGNPHDGTLGQKSRRSRT
ncbi:hypothetical protein B1748_34760 [Paenibacillus sp. MY03]|nr:hypothetical protein B1748_34760 [Paenibacillus sp. MY03]